MWRQLKCNFKNPATCVHTVLITIFVLYRLLNLYSQFDGYFDILNALTLGKLMLSENYKCFLPIQKTLSDHMTLAPGMEPSTFIPGAVVATTSSGLTENPFVVAVPGALSVNPIN
jgi:hypothetical protein